MPKSKQQKRHEAVARQVAFELKSAQWLKDYDECFGEDGPLSASPEGPTVSPAAAKS